MAIYNGSDKRLQYLFTNGCKVISGYYYNGNFYKESSHTTLITGSTDSVYIDVSTTKLYLYNSSSYDEVGSGSSTLGGLTDVDITTPTDGQALIYDSANSRWVNGAGGGSSTLDGLTDVNITTPTNGQVLSYDSTNSEWVNTNGGGICHVISGYYNNGIFYEDQSYTTAITGDVDNLYIDLNTTTLYMYDGANYKIVETDTTGGEGTAGHRETITLAANASIVKTFEELGITQRGYYLIGMASTHAEYSGGWKWFGYLSYSGTYTSSYPSTYLKYIDNYNTNVTLQESAKTLTFQNTNGTWSMTYSLEVLPLHPKFNIGDGGYYEDVNINANSSAVRTLTELNILEKGVYFISFIAPATNYWCLGYLVFKNSTESYAQSTYVSMQSNGSSISYSESNRTLTFSNNSAWATTWRIEVLSLHPKINTVAESNLTDLKDVTITTPTNGQALIYDSANSKWVNGNVSSGSSSLAGLTDVTLTAPTNGQVLSYDSANSVWINSNGGGVCHVVSGYYNNGTFYEDQSYTTAITGSVDNLYIDLNSNKLYLYDGSNYIEVSSQSSGAREADGYTCDLLLENTSLTPASGDSQITKDYTLSHSIDSYDAVLVQGYLFVNNSGVGNIESLLIFKSDYYARCTNQTDTVAWAFVLNATVTRGVNPTRRLSFGFTDSTHIRTLSTRVSDEEPMLYKVYGLRFAGNGTVGTRINTSIESNQTVTYTCADLGIKEKGCYFISITSGHNAWMEYLGYFFFSNTVYGYTTSGLFNIHSAYLSVTFTDSTSTFSITNTSNYGESHTIEVLPLHPKIEVPKHTYSTTEQVVGTWIDGKPIYEKTVDLGYLANNGTIYVNHDISNIGDVVSLQGIAKNGNGITIPLPFISTSSLSYCVQLSSNTTQIFTITGTDRSGFYAYALIQYTKTTD